MASSVSSAERTGILADWCNFGALALVVVVVVVVAGSVQSMLMSGFSLLLLQQSADAALDRSLGCRRMASSAKRIYARSVPKCGVGYEPGNWY
ncbi:potassium channel protein [Anopheles sinensis]|uniref:Potassium channel protein n=1 Tax=Anopheles sinensis TaxID=74873 RepID=A0A084WS11_ANOSI|nr:potassium channel protein [Anopheles sinensis]